jgi:hypothetical protein
VFCGSHACISTDQSDQTARANIQELTGQLQTLGATKVLTYDAFSDKSLRIKVREWTDGKVLNRVHSVCHANARR